MDSYNVLKDWIFLCSRMYWLAEQGLALNGALFVIIPSIFYILCSSFQKGERIMKNKKDASIALKVALGFFKSISSCIAGGALLTNVFYWDKNIAF